MMDFIGLIHIERSATKMQKIAIAIAIGILNQLL